jgi:hypothetical protein
LAQYNAKAVQLNLNLMLMEEPAPFLGRAIIYKPLFTSCRKDYTMTPNDLGPSSVPIYSPLCSDCLTSGCVFQALSKTRFYLSLNFISQGRISHFDFIAYITAIGV